MSTVALATVSKPSMLCRGRLRGLLVFGGRAVVVVAGAWVDGSVAMLQAMWLGRGCGRGERLCCNACRSAVVDNEEILGGRGNMPCCVDQHVMVAIFFVVSNTQHFSLHCCGVES